MSWAVGYDTRWKRDIGYGVPARCDHPKCDREIERGLAYVCGNDPYGGAHGCGLFFCSDHLQYASRRSPLGERDVTLCARCRNRRPPFDPKRDAPEWMRHKLTDDSWARWRAEHPRDARALLAEFVCSEIGL